MSCLEGAIPPIVLAFTAVIPDLEFALSLSPPDIPFAIPNMILAVLLPELGLPAIALNADLTFDIPAPVLELGFDVDIIIETITAIIELVIGLATIPIGMIDLFLQVPPEVPTPEIILELLLSAIPSLVMPDAALALVGCLAEPLGVSGLL